MNRELLTLQVKEEYARLAGLRNQGDFVDLILSSSEEPRYYERLLSQVLEGIREGRFDSFPSGLSIVEAVASDKSKWDIQG